MAANASLALKAGACVRFARLVMTATDTRHPRRSQAENPLSGVFESGQPLLSAALQVGHPYKASRTWPEGTSRVFGDIAPETGG